MTVNPFYFYAKYDNKMVLAENMFLILNYFSGKDAATSFHPPSLSLQEE